ncbi:NapC/NirT family cytochrome c [uncultured Cohaesibacter sp.]|uniref:NapC/NirT family cytochrome c n=1 Tax=uncultured Cohaesibacter sp. TaxID=1002546 RepID=UPI0029C782D2|nr:NapC/NirT family cytochrome c [uncultured Cohaesibacter sp.]
MKNPLVSIWALLKRRAAIGVVALVSIVGTLLFVGGFHTTMEATTSLKFCTSCHEMKDNVFQEYKESIHYSNPSGVRATCADCHLPQDFAGKMIRKTQALSELYHHLLGTIDTPEKFENKRLVLAKRVWARMEANDSNSCKGCHAFDTMDFAHQSEKAAAQMKKAAETGQTCISCHKGIAHELPDMSAGFRTMFKDLEAKSSEEQGKTDDLFAIAMADIWGDADKASSGGKKDGTVMPGTELKVLDRKDGLLKVAINGWQREGVERVLVATQGERIIQAALSADIANTAAVHDTVFDKDTEYNWKKVTLEGWMKPVNLISDEKALWAYGAEMYESSCGACHSLPAISHYTATQWLGMVDGMKSYTSLSKPEIFFLKSYLQYHVPTDQKH